MTDKKRRADSKVFELILKPPMRLLSKGSFWGFCSEYSNTASCCRYWLRGLDLNQRPLGYEPNELPDCSTPHLDSSNRSPQGQTTLPRGC
jgi:hypothetical protein